MVVVVVVVNVILPREKASYTHRADNARSKSFLSIAFYKLPCIYFSLCVDDADKTRTQSFVLPPLVFLFGRTPHSSAFDCLANLFFFRFSPLGALIRTRASGARKWWQSHHVVGALEHFRMPFHQTRPSK